MTTRSKRSAKSSGVEALLGQDGEMLRRLIASTGSGDDPGGGRRPRRADSGAAGLSRRLLVYPTVQLSNRSAATTGPPASMRHVRSARTVVTSAFHGCPGAALADLQQRVVRVEPPGDREDVEHEIMLPRGAQVTVPARGHHRAREQRRCRNDHGNATTGGAIPRGHWSVPCSSAARGCRRARMMARRWLESHDTKLMIRDYGG